MPIIPITCEINDENKRDCLALKMNSNDEKIGLRIDIHMQLQSIIVFPDKNTEAERNAIYDILKGYSDRYHAGIKQPRNIALLNDGEIINRIDQSCRAGLILYFLLRLAKYYPQDATLEKAYFLVENSNIIRRGSCTRQQLKMCWKKYKPVAHIQVAIIMWYILFKCESKWIKLDPLNNCISALGLLILSEKYLELAQTHVSPYQGSKGNPVLFRKNCWHASQKIDYLNRIYEGASKSQEDDLVFDMLPPFSDACEKILKKYKRSSHRGY